MKLYKKVYYKLKQFWPAQTPNSFLKKCKGVIHVGANEGQERGWYEYYHLNVIWIEPNPEVFKLLKYNLIEYPKQKAYEYLVTNEDNQEIIFKISNINGLSSSIFEFSKHKDIWPDVHFIKEIKLSSITLPALLEREKIDIYQFDTLFMDTQGSELLILKGSESILNNFKYIKTEVADFESYVGCCQLDELTLWLKERGFKMKKKEKFAHKKGVGTYYDVLYQRNN